MTPELRFFHDNIFSRLPPPPQFGHGNPFLMFLCLACLLEHRDTIIKTGKDYQDIAMYFDKLVRSHDVRRSVEKVEEYLL